MILSIQRLRARIASANFRLASVAATAVLLGADLPDARAITIRHDVPDSQYLAAGQNPAFGSVGLFLRLENTGTTVHEVPFASAVLIGDSWVLTAAHNVEGSGFAIRWETPDGQIVQRTAVEWFTHPNWTGDPETGYDLALLRLESPATPIAPTPLYLPSDGSELGKLGWMVGYGATGTGLTGYYPSTLAKRAATNVIDEIRDFGVLGVDFDHPDDVAYSKIGDPIATAMEGLAVPGDSGGGMFIEVEGVWKLAGIHSFLAFRPGATTSWGGYGFINGITRVSEHIDWISQYVVPVPEPGTLSLLALGGVMLLRRGRMHASR